MSKRLVDVPKNVVWTSSLEESYTKDHSLRIYHNTKNNKSRLLALIEDTKSDFHIVVEMLDIVEVKDESDFETIGEIERYYIDAEGSDWKKGMRAVAWWLASTVHSGHFDLGYCNLITAEKASLIGTGKLLLSVEQRHQILTTMMNDLGYWDDEQMTRDYIQKHSPDIVIPKDAIVSIADDDRATKMKKIRKEMLGEFKNPW